MILEIILYLEPAANPKDAREAAKKLLEAGVSFKMYMYIIFLFFNCPPLEVINS